MFKKALVLASTAVSLFAGMNTAVQASDVLRVGTEPTFAPFEFMDTKTRDYTGYDIDLIKAVAKKAGYKVQIQNMGFDALIPALKTGTVDVVIAGMSITPEREKQVDFSAPYYKSGLSYLIRKDEAGKIKSFKNLEGKRIAVQIGNTGAEYAKNIKGTNVVAFNTTNDAFMDLASTNSDAVILDRPVLAYFLKTKPAAAKKMQLSTEIADAEDYGFAVNKGNTKLLNALNKALEEMKADGELQKIHDKWFAN